MGRDAGLGGRGGLRAALGYHNPPQSLRWFGALAWWEMLVVMGGIGGGVY